MSRKNTLLKYQTVTSGDMSTASVTSAVTNIQFLDNIGLQINITGTGLGNFAVQVSSDYAADTLGNVTNAGHWIPLTLSPSPAATGSTSQIYIDLNQLSAPWIRLVYTKASGTGSFDSFITGKQIG